MCAIFKENIPLDQLDEDAIPGLNGQTVIEWESSSPKNGNACICLHGAEIKSVQNIRRARHKSAEWKIK